MKKYRKAINFDLDTKTLQKIFQSKNPFVYMEGYKQIGRFLKSNGFNHRQWSGYISKEPMSNTEITGIVRNLNKSLPWLKQCVRKFDVTNIGDTFDLMYLFSKQKMKIPEKNHDKSKSDDSKNSDKKVYPFSRKMILDNARLISHQERTSPQKEQNKEKDYTR